MADKRQPQRATHRHVPVCCGTDRGNRSVKLMPTTTYNLGQLVAARVGGINGRITQSN